MKKYFNKIIMLILITLLIAGCGGSSKKRASRGYFYEWSTSASSSDINAANMNKFAKDSYSGASDPPYAGVSMLDGRGIILTELFTYWEDIDGNSTPVNSEYSCDPAVGTLSLFNGKSTIYRPKQRGIQTVIATWEGHTLTIPIMVYDVLELNDYSYPVYRGKAAFDCDNSVWYDDATNPEVDIYIDTKTGKLYTPYGSQSSNLTISNITSATGEYNDQIAYLGGNSNVVKTSDNKFFKFASGGSSYVNYSNGKLLFGLLSDAEGNFAY